MDPHSYLESLVHFGVKFGLETMRGLCESLGHPERAYPTLLVAGTNGKGSVAAYVDHALRATGLRTGRYTSPHLVRVHERIVAVGEEIGEAALASVLERVRAAGSTPTYFEALTAAAFEHFRDAAVDVAILEVGMGGRLDATNVAEPIASAIVSIDFDHEAYLGSTLAAIAREKAGVLRRGRETVIGPMAAEARDAIASDAASIGARLVDAMDGVRVEPRGEALDVTTPAATYRGLRPLPGAHQHVNLVVALRLLECARDAGLAVDLSAVPDGIAATSWPGRLQHVPGDPPLLLDGAHNAAGARALAEYLRGRGEVVLLFGAMADKDVEAMAEALFPLARAVVLTRVGMERAASPEELARRAGPRAADAIREPDIGAALEFARAQARPGATVVVAGSLYLVGAVLGRLGQEGTVTIR